MAGAAAAGRDGADWRALGDFIGEAFQVADDIKDVLAKDGDIGKPVGRDAALGPECRKFLRVAAAVERLENLLAHAQDSIPACPGRDALRKLVREEASSFVPKKLLRAAAWSDVRRRIPARWRRSLQLSLRDRILALRDRLLASERFRRYAVAFPPRAFSRAVARARSSTCGRLCLQPDAACLRLARPVRNPGARTPDGGRPASPLRSCAPSRCGDCSTPPSLSTCCSHAAATASIGAGGSGAVRISGIADMVRHHAMLYADLADPVRAIAGRGRSTQLGAIGPIREAPMQTRSRPTLSATIPD